jgi:hypothetical protein
MSESNKLFPRLKQFEKPQQEFSEEFYEAYGRPSCLGKLFARGSFLHKILGDKNFLVECFSKDVWEEEARQARLVYTYVVQADNRLFEPGAADVSCAAVLIFSPDKSKAFDVDFLAGIARRLNDLKNAKNVPADALDLVERLRSESGLFVREVPESLTGGVKVIAWVETLDQKTDLPGGVIPENRVLPAFSKMDYKVDYYSGTKTINAKFYE